MTVGAPDGATIGELGRALAGLDWTGPTEPPPGSDTAGVKTGTETGSETGVVIGIVRGGAVLKGSKMGIDALGVDPMGPAEPPFGRDTA
jgi:hypothetical protein